MKRIFEYELETRDSSEIKMPVGAKVLTVHNQRDTPYIWARLIRRRRRRCAAFGCTGQGIRWTNRTCRMLGHFFWRAARLCFICSTKGSKRADAHGSGR